MRLHDRERGVVADGADVAEVVRQPFELRHQRAQIGRAGWRRRRRRCLDALGKGDAIGHRAVARDPGRQPRGDGKRRARISDSMPLCT